MGGRHRAAGLHLGLHGHPRGLGAARRIDHRAPPGAPRRGAALAEAPGLRPGDLDPADHAEHRTPTSSTGSRPATTPLRGGPQQREVLEACYRRHRALDGRTRRPCSCTATRSRTGCSGWSRATSSGRRRCATVPASIALVERLFKRSIGPDGRSVLFDLPEDAA